MDNTSFRTYQIVCQFNTRNTNVQAINALQLVRVGEDVVAEILADSLAKITHRMQAQAGHVNEHGVL